MAKTALTMSAASWAVFLCSGAAQAAPLCDDREALISQLRDRWGEAPVALGLTGAGRLLEVLATADGATWTIIATRPDGRACVLDAGTDWQRRSPRPQGAGT
jgi:hypothetical protein